MEEVAMIGGHNSNENVEEPLSPQAGGASPHPEVPGDTCKRTPCRALGEWCKLYWRCALVLAVLMALAMALCVAVAAVTGKPKGNPALPAALALACPDDWVEYQRVCYYLSPREGSWEQGQEKCSSLGASLAVLKRPWELEFLRRLKGNADYWLGLRRRGERLEWVDGSSLNETSVFPSCCRIPVRGQGECVYLNDHVFGSTSCSRQQRYLCSKPQAVM
ncbi:C-type lectin domain family 2 member B-like isoform X1 [Phalacrocorax aristotelis]|uniref:C-type lectin domain family 2 member B-like isoform X1 n=1 Tax=Phalacrocorax aristotelis TaxID=126867 RepID=UPI003F4B3283